MPLAPCLYSTPSIRWYILNLRAMCSISALSYDISWLSMYALIGLIQSIVGCCSAPSMTIRSSSFNGSTSLTEGLVNFSMMMSDRVGALEQSIHAKWSASRLSRRGSYRISKPSKTSPSFTLLPGILPSYRCCSRTLFILVLLPAESLPGWGVAECQAPWLAID
jgi:hypothetical protein